MAGYFKGSAGRSIPTLLLPDLIPERRKKDKKRECRLGKRELFLVSALFISHVRSGNPEGWCVTRHLSPLAPPQHLELRYFLITN